MSEDTDKQREINSRLDEGRERQLNVDLPADLHRRAKRKALDQDITLKQFIVEAVRTVLEASEPRKSSPEQSDSVDLVKSSLTTINLQGKTDTRARITHELADKIRQIQESTCEDAKRWLTGGCKLLLEAVAVAWEHLDVHKQRAEQAAKQGGRTDDAATKSETGGAKSGDPGTEGGQGDDKGAVPTHPSKRPRRKAS